MSSARRPRASRQRRSFQPVQTSASSPDVSRLLDEQVPLASVDHVFASPGERLQIRRDVRKEAHGFWPSRPLRPRVPVVDDAYLRGFTPAIRGAAKVVRRAVVIEDEALDENVNENILRQEHDLVVEVGQYMVSRPDVM